MKVNFNKPFRDADGKPVIAASGKEENIADRLGISLFNLVQIKGRAATPEEKYQAYCILKKIKDNPEEVEISTEDATLIKDIAAETLSAGAYGQIYDIVESK